MIAALLVLTFLAWAIVFCVVMALLERPKTKPRKRVRAEACPRQGGDARYGR